MYSKFRDGHLAPDDRNRAEAHLDACSSCRRYDRVIHTGVSVLCADEGGFIDGTLAVATVRHRAWGLEREAAMALGKAGSGITTACVVVIAFLFVGLAWFPLVLRGAPEVEIAPVAAVAPVFEFMPAYSLGDRAQALLPLGLEARFSRSAPVFQTVRLRVPYTPGVAVGVDPD